MKGSLKGILICAVLVAGLMTSAALSVASQDNKPADAAIANAPASIYVMGLLVGQNGLLQTSGPFSTEAIYSFRVAVSYVNLPPGVHTQELKLFTPEGSLYQTVITPFTTRRPRQGEIMTAKVRGLPNEVEVQRAPPKNNVSSVWAEVPVAGTWVHRIKGSWRAEVYLNGSKTPVATTQFTVQ